MLHALEPAASGRAKCPGCAQPIQRGELRFGERLPNPFAEGEITLWFHPLCAAYKRPEPLLGDGTAPERPRETPVRSARPASHPKSVRMKMRRTAEHRCAS